ncbi:MAG TPA: hypothetical protein VFM57_06280 [Thermoleophilaceae bacterium]|nr:hypothetical protein [Thermoleophilaceae bacterium]
MADVLPLDRADFDDAAEICSDAFLDDPGWLAVGPDRRERRHLVLRRYHRAALDVIEKYGGPIYGALDAGRLRGVAAAFAAGLYPQPQWALVHFVPGFLSAGRRKRRALRETLRR